LTEVVEQTETDAKTHSRAFLMALILCPLTDCVYYDLRNQSEAGAILFASTFKHC